MSFSVPFRYATRLNPADAHITRPALEARLRQNATSAGRLALLGPRRIGKSSSVPLALGMDPALPYLIVDLRRLLGPDDFCERAQRALRQFQAAGAWKFQANDLWASLLAATEQITVGPFTVAKHKTAEAGFACVHQVLASFDLLGRCVPNTTILLDEFQDVARFEPASVQQAFVSILRGAIQGHAHTAYVFAGSHRKEMYHLFFAHSAAFYHGAQLCEVGFFTPDQWTGFLREQFTLGGRALPGDLAAALLTLAGEVPDDIQLLAFHLWNQTDREQLVSLTELRTSLHQLLDEHEYRTSLLLSLISPFQAKILLALAACCGGTARYQTRLFGEIVGSSHRQTLRVAVHSLSRDEQESDEPILAVEDAVASFRDRWLYLGLLRQVLRNPAILRLRQIHRPLQIDPWLAAMLDR